MSITLTTPVAFTINGFSPKSALEVLGAGMQVGAPSGGTAGEVGTGSVNVQGNYFINGVPIKNALSIGDGMIAEDPYWEEEIYKGLPSAIGPLTVNGALAINGAQPIQELFQTANPQGAFQQFNNSAGQAYGYLGGAGTNFGTGFGAADFGISCGTLATASLRLCVNGGNTTVLEMNQAGVTDFFGPVGVQGATPAVTAGQTDIGTTTTATVITTAAGIALPALASTFWVVNVNGVKYGIPCFAL